MATTYNYNYIFYAEVTENYYSFTFNNKDIVSTYVDDGGMERIIDRLFNFENEHEDEEVYEDEYYRTELFNILKEIIESKCGCTNLCEDGIERDLTEMQEIDEDYRCGYCDSIQDAAKFLYLELCKAAKDQI